MWRTFEVKWKYNDSNKVYADTVRVYDRGCTRTLKADIERTFGVSKLETIVDYRSISNVHL